MINRLIIAEVPKVLLAQIFLGKRGLNNCGLWKESKGGKRKERVFKLDMRIQCAVTCQCKVQNGKHKYLAAHYLHICG
jgi:hypothetical protein